MVVKEDKRRGWMAYMFATKTGKSGNGHHLGGRDTVENAGRIRTMFKELARTAFPDQDLPGPNPILLVQFTILGEKKAPPEASK